VTPYIITDTFPLQDAMMTVPEHRCSTQIQQRTWVELGSLALVPRLKILVTMTFWTWHSLTCKQPCCTDIW